MFIIFPCYLLFACYSAQRKALELFRWCRLTYLCQLSLLALSWFFSIWNLILGWSPKVVQVRILLNSYFFITHDFLAIKFDRVELTWMLRLEHSLYCAKSWKFWVVGQKYLEFLKCGAVEWWIMSAGPILWKMRYYNNLEKKEHST
jgi:hypothetical protein